MPTLTIAFRLNGQPVTASVTPSLNAADLLREAFQLGSVRQCCRQGICGVCTIALNGNAVSSCLLLSPLLDGQDVVTLEGLAADASRLDPVQRAFLEESALQCGYCTPGMILMTRALLRDHPHPTEATIREYMAGNICRCGCYPEILKAIQRVGDEDAATR